MSNFKGQLSGGAGFAATNVSTSLGVVMERQSGRDCGESNRWQHMMRRPCDYQSPGAHQLGQWGQVIGFIFY
eukprot:5066816-Amphidinium_carterae.2